MKKFYAFLLVLSFAIVFVASFVPAVQQRSYAKMLNRTGQAGLAASILLFLVLPGKRKPKPVPGENVKGTR